MEKIINSSYGARKALNSVMALKKQFLYSELERSAKVYTSFRAGVLAFAIFLYYFIENGTIGLFPERWYMVYRNMRVSDLILYGLIAYSIYNIREYSDLFRSKSFLIAKIFLGYIVLEFFLSALRYHFDIIEYFFRLKGLWSSFLVLPYMLLLKRGGLMPLIKIVLPVAIISNILYILTAVTGQPFLPDVSIITQRLPWGMTVYRVYGGTFYGELYLFGFLYLWIAKKFKVYQLFLAILFLTPHILAFGRTAWVSIVFAIVAMVILNWFRNKNFANVFKQGIILFIFMISFMIAFVKFVPESDYYVDAIKARLLQGAEDVKYSEGTYDTRVHFQNNALVKLWLTTNPFIGVGMHPMWVVRPENHEEQVWYNAFCDVTWPAVLAAYGLIGFALALIFQLYNIIVSYKLISKLRNISILTYFLTFAFIKLIFDTFVCYSYALTSIGLWGLYFLNFYTAIFVYSYEKYQVEKKENEEKEIKEKESTMNNQNGKPKNLPILGKILHNNRFFPNQKKGY